MNYARLKINGKHEHLYVICGGIIVGHVCVGVTYPALCVAGFCEGAFPYPTKPLNARTPRYIAHAILDSPACNDRAVWDSVAKATKFLL